MATGSGLPSGPGAAGAGSSHGAIGRAELRVSPHTENFAPPMATRRAARPVGIKADVDTGRPAALTTPPSPGVPLQGEPAVVGKRRTATSEFDIRAAKLDGDLTVAGFAVTARR